MRATVSLSTSTILGPKYKGASVAVWEKIARMQGRPSVARALEAGVDAGVQFGSDCLHGETFEGRDQRMREAVQTISVGHDVLALHFVENFADLCRGAFVMVQK